MAFLWPGRVNGPGGLTQSPSAQDQLLAERLIIGLWVIASLTSADLVESTGSVARRLLAYARNPVCVPYSNE